MESKVAALEVEVENLKDWKVKHERDDDRTHKYMTHMMEDLLGRLSGIERSAARFEADLAHRNGNDLGTQQSLAEIFNRVRTIERIIWGAIGSTTAFGIMFAYFGHKIAELLAK